MSAISLFSSRSAVSRSSRWRSSSSTWATASSYSDCASGLTGPSCSRRRASRSSLAVSASRSSARARSAAGSASSSSRRASTCSSSVDSSSRSRTRWSWTWHSVRRSLPCRSCACSAASRWAHSLSSAATCSPASRSELSVALELLPSPGDRTRDALEGGDHAADARQQRLVACRRGTDPLDPCLSLGAFALLALTRATGCGELGAHLHAATCVGAIVGRRAPALDRRRDPPLFFARLVAASDRGAVRGDRVLGLGVGPCHRLAVTLERRAGRELGLCRGLARPDQSVAAVALGQDALLAHRRRLAELAGTRRPDPSGERHGNPAEPVVQPLEALHHPHVAQQRPRERRGIGRPVDVSGERLGAVLGRRLGACLRLRGSVGRRDQRAPAIRAGAVEQRGGGRQIAQHGGA